MGARFGGLCRRFLLLLDSGPIQHPRRILEGPYLVQLGILVQEAISGFSSSSSLPPSLSYMIPQFLAGFLYLSLHPRVHSE
jgi:hypothetical protein